jgi:membrane protein DedA with SNARE-associated domain
LGTLAAKEILNIVAYNLVIGSKHLGDSINYTIGKYFSDKIINKHSADS